MRLEQGGPWRLFGPRLRFRYQDPSAISALWQRFAPGMGAIAGRIGSHCYGVVYHGDATAADYLCAVQVADFPPQPADYTQLTLVPRLYAVFAHTGPVAAISQTWGAIYQTHLPAARRRPQEAPAFELYDERYDPVTASGTVEIWVPVEP